MWKKLVYNSDTNSPAFGGRLTLFCLVSRSPTLVHKSPAVYVHYKYYSIRLLIVCRSCKTSYNVPIPIGGWVNFSGGGGGSLQFQGRSKKNSLPILGLQRLASLHTMSTFSLLKQAVMILEIVRVIQP